MTIVGFSFTKMHIERKGAVSGKISIKNNVAVKSVEKSSLSLGAANQDGLRFTFEFTTNYEPKVAEIVIGGEVIDLQPPEKVDEVVKSWKKDKKIDAAIMTQILNAVLSRCNVQALIMGKDMNLPPHIPLPKVTQQQPGRGQ